MKEPNKKPLQKVSVLFHALLFVAFFLLAGYHQLFRDTGKTSMSVILLWLGMAVAAGLVIYDFVTLLRARERAFEEEIERAHRRDQLKDSLLLNLSRDVRTPMNAIVGSTELALRDMSDEQQVAASLEQIRLSGSHLLTLVDDVVELGRMGEQSILLKEEREYLPQMMNHFADGLLSRTESKGQSLSLNVQYLDNEYIVCDKKRMEQMLRNLASAFSIATPEGGKIEVGVSQVEASDSDRAKYEFYVLSMDPGIPGDTVERMKELLMKGQEAQTGPDDEFILRLIIVGRLVRLMGGLIDLESISGAQAGCYITMELKSADRPAGETPVADVPAPPRNFSGKRALVVDDIMINRQIAEAVLGLYGIEAEEARDGAEALERLRQQDPGYYDVVLMDIMMPNMDGYKATKKIRELPDRARASVPVFALTANVFDEDRRLAYEAGVDGYIPKPIDGEQMMEALADVFEDNGGSAL